MEQEPQIEIVADLSALGIMVFCYTCCQTLYEAEKKDTTTQKVAEMVGENHWEAFSDEHSVVILDFTPIQYI